MKRFFIVWGGQAVSLLGSQLVQFALIWYLTTTTGSATMLALATLAGLLPQIILGPLAGALVDRWSRRRVMIFADMGIALATIVLAVDFALGAAQPWHVLVLMALRAIGAAFHWPAMQASTSLMVPEEHLARIAGLNQALWGGMNILSAPLGALLLTFLPTQGILMIDVVTALFAITPLLFIAIPQPPRKQAEADQEAAPPSSFGDDFKAGLRYVWDWKGMFMLMVLATVLNMLVVPAFSLLPLHVTDYFGRGAGELAAIEAAMSAGTIGGGLLLGAWGGFKKRMYTSLMGLLGMGVAILALGLMPREFFWAAVGAMALGGVMMALTNGPLFAILQAIVEPEMQGRVFTLVGSLSALASPLGLLVVGPLVDVVGTQMGYITGGAACLLLGLVSVTMREIREIEAFGRASEGIAAKDAAAVETEQAATPVADSMAAAR